MYCFTMVKSKLKICASSLIVDQLQEHLMDYFEGFYNSRRSHLILGYENPLVDLKINGYSAMKMQ